MSNDSLDPKIEELMDFREKHASLKFELDEISKKEKNLQDEIIQIMDDRELTSVRHKRFGLISIAERIWAKIIPGEFEDVKQFFEREGLDREIFKLKPVSKRLNEFVKEAIEKGRMLPKGISFTPTRYISVRKG